MIKNLLYRLCGIKPLSKEEIEYNLRREREGYEDEICDECQENVEQKKNIYEGAILSLNLILNREGQLYIDGKWIEQSPYMEDIIAQFLFLLNNGDVRPYLFNYLVGCKEVNKDIEYHKFIDNIIIKWGKLIQQKEEIEDLPIVQPSRAFLFNQLKTQQVPQSDEDGD